MPFSPLFEYYNTLTTVDYNVCMLLETVLRIQCMYIATASYNSRYIKYYITNIVLNVVDTEPELPNSAAEELRKALQGDNGGQQAEVEAKSSGRGI